MKIVGVSACTMGLAHTYIVQEKLEEAGSKAGHEVKIETQGTIGKENELTAKEIEEADVVILAIDVKISDMDRFEGKRKVTVPTEVAMKSPNKLIQKVEEIVEKQKV